MFSRTKVDLREIILKSNVWKGNLTLYFFPWPQTTKLPIQNSYLYRVCIEPIWSLFNMQRENSQIGLRHWEAVGEKCQDESKCFPGLEPSKPFTAFSNLPMPSPQSFSFPPVEIRAGRALEIIAELQARDANRTVAQPKLESKLILQLQWRARLFVTACPGYRKWQLCNISKDVSRNGLDLAKNVEFICSFIYLIKFI